MGIFDDFFPILDIGKDIASNLFAEEQQKDSQIFNSAEAAANRGFNREEAEKQREWTRTMRRTGYQDTMHDLASAGLNPMMALGHGATGAGAGAAASGTAASAGIATPSPKHSVTSGMQSASQISVNQALEERTRAEAAKVRAEEKEVLARTETYPVSIEQMKQQIGESAVRIEKIWAEEANVKQMTLNLKAELPRIAATVDNLRALTRQAGAITGLTEAQTSEVKQRVAENLPKIEAALRNLEITSHKLAIPAQEASATAADSYIGQLGGYLRQLTSSLNGLLLGIPTGRSPRPSVIINQGKK